MRRSAPAAALALLIGIAAQYSGTVHAQGDFSQDFSNQEYQDQIRISVNTRNCFDAKRPPSERISSCTIVIERGNVGKTNAAKLYVARGTVLSGLGKHDAAIADFTHAIALDPHDRIAYSNRAAEYLTSSRFELAIVDLTEVIRADPANAMAFYSRATAYEQSGERNKALDDYRNAARLLPSFAPATAALGRLLKASDPDAALSELSAAIQLYPKSPALRSRAMLYLSLGRFEQALLDFNQVIASDGEFDASLNDYTRVIGADPKNAVAYFKRGNIHLDSLDFVRACSDYSDSLKLDPNQPVALYNKAIAETRLGRRQDAAEDQRRALALDPSLASEDRPPRQ